MIGGLATIVQPGFDLVVHIKPLIPCRLGFLGESSEYARGLYVQKPLTVEEAGINVAQSMYASVQSLRRL